MGRRKAEPKRKANPQRASLGKRLAAVCGVIAAAAVLLANLETIVQTTRRLIGVAPPVVPARLVLEDVRLAPGIDPRWNLGQWHLTTIATDQYARESKASDEADASGYIPGSMRPVREGACSTPSRVEARRTSAIKTVATDWDGLQPAGELLKANSLGMLLYTAHWLYHDTIAAAGSRLVQRPMPEDSWDAIEWCGELHRAVADSLVVQPPVFQVVLRNTSATPATVLRAEARPIRSYGGEAGGGGVAIEPVGERTNLTLTHEAPVTEDLKNPVRLDPNGTTMLEFGLHVADADPGDGPGELLFQLVLHYFDGTSVSELPVGNFILNDRVWEIDTSLGCGPMRIRC